MGTTETWLKDYKMRKRSACNAGQDAIGSRKRDFVGLQVFQGTADGKNLRKVGRRVKGSDIVIKEKYSIPRPKGVRLPDASKIDPNVYFDSLPAVS
jgi:hypothetical protein